MIKLELIYALTFAHLGIYSHLRPSLEVYIITTRPNITIQAVLSTPPTAALSLRHEASACIARRDYDFASFDT